MRWHDHGALREVIEKSQLSSASGVGLFRAIAGEEAHFIIQSKDLGGNNKIDNEARFDVYLSLIDSDNLSVLLGSLEYVGNGQHLVKYTCFVSGDYVLVVQDKAGDNIAGSPFRVAVGPAAMSGPHSRVVGQGLVSGMAGEVAEVRVLGRDKYDNPVNQDYGFSVVYHTIVVEERNDA